MLNYFSENYHNFGKVTPYPELKKKKRIYEINKLRNIMEKSSLVEKKKEREKKKTDAASKRKYSPPKLPEPPVLNT